MVRWNCWRHNNDKILTFAVWNSQWTFIRRLKLWYLLWTLTKYRNTFIWIALPIRLSIYLQGWFYFVIALVFIVLTTQSSIKHIYMRLMSIANHLMTCVSHNNCMQIACTLPELLEFYLILMKDKGHVLLSIGTISRKVAVKPYDIMKHFYDTALYVYLARTGCLSTQIIYIYGLCVGLFIGTSGIGDTIYFALTPAYTNYYITYAKYYPKDLWCC